eukprot:CAMPEP_0197864908 /NCGR_PEP_ID=MMETSP1438-20131217/43356_1 /TAXON_ID=1461541 /ORGANISM="Pterosperma sp., Strain CCMP1384" /LENGTH=265 /DNA_ID=CAMNT_0043483287 /DNA_START=278 /DNA_END=1075 /DNA_ORIENTATION=-
MTTSAARKAELLSDPVLSPATQELLASFGTPLSSSGSGTKLPDIRKPPKRVDSGLTTRSMPTERLTLPSVTPTSARAAVTSRTEMSCVSDNMTNVSVPKSFVSGSDWKNDSQLKDWYKQIQRRRIEEQALKVRQANKDAAWILSRRQAQMKIIEKRQKLEKQEAELKARNQPNRGLQKFKRVSTLVGAAAMNMKDTKRRMARDPEEREAEKELEMEHEPMPFNQNHGALQWQPCPKMKAKEKKEKEPKQVAVWVKPGLFTTKTLT